MCLSEQTDDQFTRIYCPAVIKNGAPGSVGLAARLDVFEDRTTAASVAIRLVALRPVMQGSGTENLVIMHFTNLSRELRQLPNSLSRFGKSGLLARLRGLARWPL